MEWDLNNIQYTTFPDIDVDKLFSTITHYQVFCYYIDEELKLGKPINSPLRKDHIPSFALFKHRAGTILYKDFATGEVGDSVRFIQRLKNVTYRQALYIIACDFNYVQSNVEVTNKIEKYIKLQTPSKKPINIGIKKRGWQQCDKEYWGQYEIKRRTLDKFWVCAARLLFFNDALVKPDKHCYAYKEIKDDKTSYKILQPYSDYKWINNANDSIHQGYRQLPERGELLIITKALKDVMSLHDVTGNPAIGLQAESVSMKSTVMKEYKRRFERVICLFDNDVPGRKFSKRFSSEFDIQEVFMPQEMSKDFSDVVKDYGSQEALGILTEITY
jgi:5S rRNA maturation endonuclease (ribonuclease M5)